MRCVDRRDIRADSRVREAVVIFFFKEHLNFIPKTVKCPCFFDDETERVHQAVPDPSEPLHTTF